MWRAQTNAQTKRKSNSQGRPRLLLTLPSDAQTIAQTKSVVTRD